MTTTPARTDRKPPPPTPREEDCERIEQEALIDFESEQSFPASDPPSWTLGPDKEPANG